MTVTAISDIHGHLIKIDPCDILLICGDVSPLEIQKDYTQMISWLFKDFRKWIEEMPCDRVIMTPGNHDYLFQKICKEYGITELFGKLYILVNAEFNHYDSNDDKWYKIYGTPQCKQFGTWPYMPGNINLPNFYKRIPENVDILITHDSPEIGYVGNIMEAANANYPNGIPAGNPYLKEAILDKKPKYVLSGHIHSGDHNLTEYEDIKLANVSLLDESYDVVYKPLTFTL